MKSVLVIDMPTHCGECPVKCRMRGINHVPTWCPLRPIPQMMRTDEDDIEEDSYWEGWNDCIKALEDSQNWEDSNE